MYDSLNLSLEGCPRTKSSRTSKSRYESKRDVDEITYLFFIWSLSGIEDTHGEHNARRQWSRICPGFTLKWVIYHFSWEIIIRALVLTHFIRLFLGESSICDETRLTTETVCWGTELCVWRLSRNSILESAKNIEASVGHYSRNHVHWIYQEANSVCHHRTSPSWTTTKI